MTKLSPTRWTWLLGRYWVYKIVYQTKSKTGNGVLCTVVHTLQQSVLSVWDVIKFLGIHINVVLFKLTRKNTSFPLSIFVQQTSCPVTIQMCSLSYRNALKSVKKCENTDRNSFTPFSSLELIFANHPYSITFVEDSYTEFYENPINFSL